MRKIGMIFCLMGILGQSAGVLAQSTPSTSDCPQTQFTEWGDVGIVSPRPANNVRANPTTTADLIGRLNAGDTFFVQYVDPVCADGYLWREVSTLEFTGWTVEIPVGETTPFLVPFVAEIVEVGERQEDGSIVVDAAGVTFTIPAALAVERVTLTPEIGLFGDVMGARPSFIQFDLWRDQETPFAEITIYPYALSATTYDLMGNETLESLLDESVVLADFVGYPPQTPISGVAALFFGAPQYLAFGSGAGLRYLTYFAQDSVLFSDTTVFSYLYRGISADENFFIAARGFAVHLPSGTLPSGGGRDDSAYSIYLRALKENLAVLPNNAYIPDLTQVDTIFASLTITDVDALLHAIP